jgi:hypothetical protein
MGKDERAQYRRLCEKLASNFSILGRDSICKFLGPTFALRPSFIDAAQKASRKRRFDAKDADDDAVR